MSQSTVGFAIALPFTAYLINPFLGIIIMFIILASDSGINEKAYFFLYAMIALYWGFVNTTRIPESDLLNYKNIFDSATTYSFGEYLSGFNSEIIYYIFSYISNKILFGNFNLYLILVTFIQYYLIFISMHKLFKKDKKYALLFAVFLLFIDTTIFFSSVHLLRQMTAGSIFVYYFVTLIVEKKNKWWLVPIFVLIHSSSIILFLLTLIPNLNKRISNKNLVILFIVFFITTQFGSLIIAILDAITKGIPILNYPFSRYQDIGRMDYSWYDGAGVFGIRIRLIIFYIIPILVTYLFKAKKEKYYPIMNLCLIYYFILEMYVFAGLTYMQLRMSYYLYPFMGILLLIFISTIHQKFGNTTKRILIVVLFAYFSRRFIRAYMNTDFLIAPLDKIILNPTFAYIYDIFT